MWKWFSSTIFQVCGPLYILVLWGMGFFQPLTRLWTVEMLIKISACYTFWHFHIQGYHFTAWHCICAFPFLQPVMHRAHISKAVIVLRFVSLYFGFCQVHLTCTFLSSCFHVLYLCQFCFLLLTHDFSLLIIIFLHSLPPSMYIHCIVPSFKPFVRSLT